MTRLLRFILTLPRWGAIAGITLVAVVVSLSLTAMAHLLLDSPEGSQFVVVSFVLAGAIPLLVAGPVAHVIVGLLHTVDAARKESQRLASVDLLTGALNRRRFVELGERVWGRSQFDEAPMSALLLDIDNFKTVNDVHGHAAGDEVLRAVALACQLALRPTDPFARWGGEEFVALLPDTDAEEAFNIALRVLAAIAKASVPLPNEAPLAVTASIGVATCVGATDTLSQLLARADAGMYRAKRQGKNRVQADSPGAPTETEAPPARPEPALQATHGIPNAPNAPDRPDTPDTAHRPPSAPTPQALAKQALQAARATHTPAKH